MESPESSVHSSPDWRHHLRSDVRHGIINQMVVVLTKTSSRIDTERAYDFRTVGIQLEEAAYNVANCQEEYVHRICANLAQFWMQTISRPVNSANSDVNYVHPVAATTSSTSTANMADWQEVAYQKIQQMKTQHFADLKAIFEELRWYFNELGGVFMQGWQGLEFLVKMRASMNTIVLIMKDLQVQKSSIDTMLIMKISSYEARLLHFIGNHRSLIDRLANARPLVG